MTKITDLHTKWMNDPKYAAAYEADELWELRSFKDLVQRRIASDPAFAAALEEQEDIEDRAAVAAYRAAKAKGEVESIPSEMVDRMLAGENSPQPINHPDPDNPEPMFPGMPHDVHRAIITVIEYAGSLSAAGALLAEYALKTSRE